MKRSPACWKLGQQKTNSAESSSNSVSDSRRPLVKVEGPHSYGWKDICLTKYLFLYNLSFLVSSNPAMNRQVAVGTIEGLWQCVPKAPLSAGPQQLLPKPEGVLLSLLFLVPRIRSMKTVSTGQVFSRFPSRL